MIDITTLSQSLTRDSAGLWTAGSESGVSYPEDGNELLNAIEPHSFWFRHRNKCIIRAVKRFAGSIDSILDIGGGNGFVAMGLQNAGFDVALLEPGPKGAANALRRGVRTVIRAAFEDAQFKPDSLPSISLFDVVEHIEDDAGFLRHMCEAQRKGSFVIVTVPAYMTLWTTEDVLAGHYRRYTLRQLRAVVEAVGYRVRFGTYFFSTTLPLALLMKKLNDSPDALTKENMEKSHLAKNKPMRALLELCLAHEPFLMGRGVRIPFGGSCFMIAEK